MRTTAKRRDRHGDVLLQQQAHNVVLVDLVLANILIIARTGSAGLSQLHDALETFAPTVLQCN